MNSVARVMDVIRRRPGASFVRGELTVEPAFARDYLTWRADGPGPDALDDMARVIACCRVLKLDLVGIPFAGTSGHLTATAAGPSDFSPFAAAGLCIFALLDGAFQKTATSRQLMTLLADMGRRPDEVAAALRGASRQVTADMAAAVAAGAHGIIIADDIAYRQSTYMAPEWLARHLLPLWQDQVAAARDSGCPVFFHSDGNLNRVLPHLVAAGFDGLCGLEPAAGMDVREIRRGCARQLCLMGTMDPGLLCDQPGCPGADGGYDRLTRALADEMAAGREAGGVIFGTCSGLYAGMSPQRVQFMVDAFEK